MNFPFAKMHPTRGGTWIFKRKLARKGSFVQKANRMNFYLIKCTLVYYFCLWHRPFFCYIYIYIYSKHLICAYYQILPTYVIHCITQSPSKMFILFNRYISEVCSKISRIRLNLPRLKWAMEETLILFKIVPLTFNILISASFW